MNSRAYCVINLKYLESKTTNVAGGANPDGPQPVPEPAMSVSQNARKKH